ncbi:hypothetical protein [Xanthomarina sp.]|uniref:hypothetical protein n=1 Tax=Xanthomarina sp. TaxID=1931211 RepID=UPI002CC5E3EF|nr:hypothetical protein [Xanthomarina sp.]HLV38608.1 hypothetical protein [Xanthomarina sp.]
MVELLHTNEKDLNPEEARRKELKEITNRAFEQCYNALDTIDAIMDCLNELESLLNKNKINKESFKTRK